MGGGEEPEAFLPLDELDEEPSEEVVGAAAAAPSVPAAVVSVEEHLNPVSQVRDRTVTHENLLAADMLSSRAKSLRGEGGVGPSGPVAEGFSFQGGPFA